MVSHHLSRIPNRQFSYRQYAPGTAQRQLPAKPQRRHAYKSISKRRNIENERHGLTTWEVRQHVRDQRHDLHDRADQTAQERLNLSGVISTGRV